MVCSQTRSTSEFCCFEQKLNHYHTHGPWKNKSETILIFPYFFVRQCYMAMLIVRAWFSNVPQDSHLECLVVCWWSFWEAMESLGNEFPFPHELHLFIYSTDTYWMIWYQLGQLISFKSWYWTTLMYYSWT